MYLLLNFVIIFLIALFMEIYKKSIRKNNHSKYECWGVGFFMSMLGVFILRLTGTMYFPFNTYLNAYLWVDYALYVLLYYVIQLKFDMLVIKKILKSLIMSVLDNTDLTDEQKEFIADKLTAKKKSVE